MGFYCHPSPNWTWILDWFGIGSRKTGLGLDNNLDVCQDGVCHSAGPLPGDDGDGDQWGPGEGGHPAQAEADHQDQAEARHPGEERNVEIFYISV